MKTLLTAKQMANADKFTIQKRLVPSMVLMERAAISVCEEVKKMEGIVHVGVLCGVGNNGGDGLAIVRLLSESGYKVSYFVLGEEADASDNCKAQMAILKAYGYTSVKKYRDLSKCDLLIDAVLGTGLNREVDEVLNKVFSVINGFTMKKIAVDIPSGINATSGEIMGNAIRCDMTVTFAYALLGHFLYPGRQYCGEVLVKDIGITDEALPDYKETVSAYEASDLSRLLPKRLSDSHKGTYGKVLVIAGSKNMAGAAYLAAKACYLTGAGLVRILTEEDNRVILQQLLPEATLQTYENEINPDMLTKEIAWAQTIVIGPGLGNGPDKEALLKAVFEQAKCPICCDADGLNILAKNMSILKKKHPPTIITPHLGEMNRLCNEQIFDIMHNMIRIADNFSDRYNVVTILKSASTVVSVPKGRNYLNLYGNNGMSTGGSGDILAGILGGLLAQKMTPEQAAVLGVAIHSLAGDEAKKYVGAYAMKAEDILEGLILVLKQLEQEMA